MYVSQILYVLLFKRIASMGAHMHGSREASYWHSRNDTLPTQGVGRKGHRAVPRRRCGAVFVDIQYMDVNLTSERILQHECGGDLAGGLTRSNQAHVSVVGTR